MDLTTLTDEELLAVVGATMDATDPVPDRAIAAARAAWVWRTVDAELAELTFDSAVAEPTGVRSASGTRTVTFASEQLEIEVVVLAHVGRQLVGQLVPAQTAEVELRLPDGTSRTATAGTAGDFVFDDVPAGPAQLSVAASVSQVVTDWIVL